MSDIEEYGRKDKRRDKYSSDEEGSDEGYDTRRARYSDDDEDDEEEDDEDEDDELRREGFLVDDDEEEEEEEEDSRKRKKKKKRRRRHHNTERTEDDEDDDGLDSEDLALVAENTNQEVAAAAGAKFKRLKRGRASRVDDSGEDLRAELDDLMDTGDGGVEGNNDDLGLFDDGVESDISAHDYRATRRMGRDRNAGQEDSDGLVDDPLSAPRGRRAAAGHDDDIDAGAGAGARSRRDDGASEGNYMFDRLESIDDDTWMELQDIFGDGEEYAFAMEGPQTVDTFREKTLADVFEPAELEAKMMTQLDDDIRTLDIPERIQMRAAGSAEALRALSDDEINEEATWIIGKLHRWQTRMRELRGEDGESGELLFKQAEFFSERFLAGVLEVLKHMSHDFYEVPYIYQHCRELFVQGSGSEDETVVEDERSWLTLDDLWSLYDHEHQFRGFLGSRRHVRNVIRRLGDSAVITTADTMYVSDFIASANCVEDISDVVEWLQARYGGEMRKWATRAAKRSATETDPGLEQFVARMGISARQIGENIGAPGRHTVQDSAGDALPLEAARELAGDRFGGSGEAALRAGVGLFAAQLAVDPHIRRYVRAYCEAHACVVVRPTERGLREITDADHAAFAFKFVRQKPVAAFAGSGQFLEVAQAWDAGLVRVGFSLTTEYRFGAPGSGDDDAAAFAADAERSALVVARQLDAHARSYAAHDAAGAWNSVRSDAVLQAARTVLAMVWRETAQRLRAQAADHVADACRRALQARIDVQAPRTGARVVVVAGGGFDASSRGALRVVYVDEDGRARDDFSADSLRRDSGSGGGSARLAELLLRRPVDVVAVAGMAMLARRVFDDVRALVDDHCMRHAADIMVTYARDDAARLWCDSDAARQELPLLRREERYCVAVARTLQDAPSAFAALGADVLKLRLHPAQRLVDSAVLLPAVQRAFVNVVAKTGVDVNAAAALPHRAHMLPFVAGLGPRKAHVILARTSPSDPLESRNDLVTRRLVTRCVFVNCASFLRVRPALADALDATRIHPQDYILAYKMALDALDIDDDDRRPARYVAEVMRRAPDKLDDLDLVGYAAELRRKGLLKLDTLRFIKHELQHPDDDARAPYAPPDDAQVLEMLAGERIGHTLRDDGSSLVSATIVRVQPRFAIARLDSGLEGFISVANVADYRIDAVSDELAPGQAVVAVVKRIDLEMMSLDLSTRQQDIDDALRRSAPAIPDSAQVDKYFDFDAEAVLRERAAAALSKKASARMRSIPHPLFKPLSSREAEHFLADRPRGHCVIRPSSRGPDHIAITWKVAAGLFQHIDVLERDKPRDAALANTFLVGDAAYTDLDELVAFHVDPIVRKLDEVARNPKFYDPESDPLYSAQPVHDILGPNDFSDQYRARRQDLWESRTARHLDTLAQSTGRGSYCISLSLQKPGALVLAFKPTPAYAGIMKWTARVEPNEFKLGERGRYPDINGLINGFKRMQTSTTNPTPAYAATDQ
ncbi:Transcription elongation factor spt6 [Coemansia sp. BCRC 34301]|nr:Transcription elongation factor spt6 [Coemansia sp. BCRC 34301]